MFKIIVAGAGNGGLTAAANLAKNGFDVTVVEAKERADSGHDWLDSILISAFEQSGIPTPDMKQFKPQYRMCYYDPEKALPMVSPNKPNPEVGYIDRKFLMNHLIDECVKQGVKFLFSKKILSAVTEKGRVTGIKTEDGEMNCDLVIDSAGADSPLRRSLPKEFGIRNELKDTERFFAYRAFYEKTDGAVSLQPYNTYFFHCGRAGMDWVITDKDYVDVLVGGFKGLTEAETAEALADFSKDYPNMGNKILRGGQTELIPLRRTLPKIVCDGYAAVGDSAVMVEPLSGSGISLSMMAGKILADTVIKYRNADKETLWQYQYEYFTRHGNGQLTADIIRNCLFALTAEELQYLFRTKILSTAEIAGGGMPDYTAKEMLMKGVNMIKRPAIVPHFAKMLTGMMKTDSVCRAMPRVYDEKKIRNWAERYEGL